MVKNDGGTRQLLEDDPGPPPNSSPRQPKCSPYNFQPKHDQQDQHPQPKTTIKSVFKDFTTKPIPLPIWLWNLIVIGIYLWVGYLLITFAVYTPGRNSVPVLLTPPHTTKPPHPVTAFPISQIFDTWLPIPCRDTVHNACTHPGEQHADAASVVSVNSHAKTWPTQHHLIADLANHLYRRRLRSSLSIQLLLVRYC